MKTNKEYDKNLAIISKYVQKKNYEQITELHIRTKCKKWGKTLQYWIIVNSILNCHKSTAIIFEDKTSILIFRQQEK